MRQDPVKERDLTEIDRASLALQSMQPDLEAWPDDPEAEASPAKPRRIWPVVVAIWIGGIALLSAVVFTVISYIIG
jgi:hypothetical protein